MSVANPLERRVRKDKNMTKKEYKFWHMPVLWCEELTLIIPIPFVRQQPIENLQLPVRKKCQNFLPKLMRKHYEKKQMKKGNGSSHLQVLENIIEQEKRLSEQKLAESRAIIDGWLLRILSFDTPKCYQPKEKTIPRTWSAKEFCVRGLLLAKKVTSFPVGLSQHLIKPLLRLLPHSYFLKLLTKNTCHSSNG